MICQYQTTASVGFFFRILLSSRDRKRRVAMSAAESPCFACPNAVTVRVQNPSHLSGLLIIPFNLSSSRRQTLLFKVYWIPARSITFYDHSGMIDWAQTRIVKLASVYIFRILLKTRGPKFWKQHTLTVIFFFIKYI